MSVDFCCERCSDGTFPDAFTVHIAGSCCRCAEYPASSECGFCKDESYCPDCGALNQTIVVRRNNDASLAYEYQFRTGDFLSGKVPCEIIKATLELTKKSHDGKTWYSACFALHFSQASGKRPATWYRSRITDCCSIGLLRRHIPGRTCCWPQFIEVQTIPTPDFVPSAPEWTR